MFICIQRAEERVIAHNQLEEKSIRYFIFNILSSSWIRKTLAYVSSCHFNIAKQERKKKTRDDDNGDDIRDLTQQDGRMTKKCGARLCISKFYATFFRNSAVQSVPNVLMCKVPIIGTRRRQTATPVNKINN